MYSPPSKTFVADAVLFDMDGTLTDSIAAVEAAWAKVASEIGQDPEHVIAATHGKRAVDNLSQFKPHLAEEEMEREVERFENTILYYADAHHLHGPNSGSVTPPSDVSYASSAHDTPDLTPGPSAPASRRSSVSAFESRRPSFGSRLLNMLSQAARLRAHNEDVVVVDEDGSEKDNLIQPGYPAVEKKNALNATLEAWQMEAASVDRSIRILPGVRKMIDSLPEGRYAVATSGAKTYAYGCMKRVGIVPPPVTITADDKRLKAGKPAPDPFLLAAECLGYDPKRCVVFEDSPSGIKAGVASGATVVAVCTSHERSKIENCGAHYIIEDMESISCHVGDDDRLVFTITSSG
ncbi:putative phosphatase HAD1 [Psilocybe cubensis]|uniref:HAD-like protein n=2 Tax=Psilocybe cubensis TaxID=181762 RepID=A0A8H7XSJ6_PSICU|nr:putative phosphatase HAD1 [Psilocybe cubensis]KAH9480865.1 putative phosphatase HAD1 [Psilocybe cubensis]